jgi:hypothetical protein
MQPLLLVVLVALYMHGKTAEVHLWEVVPGSERVLGAQE